MIRVHHQPQRTTMYTPCSLWLHERTGRDWLLDLAEIFPTRIGGLDLPAPDSGEVLPHGAYAAELPDVVDEALWNLDFYRRLQDDDGGVGGGRPTRAHRPMRPSTPSPRRATAR